MNKISRIFGVLSLALFMVAGCDSRKQLEVDNVNQQGSAVAPVTMMKQAVGDDTVYVTYLSPIGDTTYCIIGLSTFGNRPEVVGFRTNIDIPIDCLLKKTVACYLECQNDNGTTDRLCFAICMAFEGYDCTKQPNAPAK